MNSMAVTLVGLVTLVIAVIGAYALRAGRDGTMRLLRLVAVALLLLVSGFVVRPLLSSVFNLDSVQAANAVLLFYFIAFVGMVVWAIASNRISR